MKKETERGKNKDLLDTWNILNTQRNMLINELNRIEDVIKFIEKRNNMKESL